jgi:hypothetical protein
MEASFDLYNRADEPSRNLKAILTQRAEAKVKADWRKVFGGGGGKDGQIPQH